MKVLFKYIFYSLLIASCFNLCVIANTRNPQNTTDITFNKEKEVPKPISQSTKTQEKAPKDLSIETHLLTLHKTYQNKLYQAKGFPILIKRLEKTAEGVLIDINYAPRFSKEALPYLEETLKATLENSLILFDSEKPLFVVHFNEDETLKTIWEN